MPPAAARDLQKVDATMEPSGGRFLTHGDDADGNLMTS